MVVFDLVVIGLCSIGNVTDNMKHIALLDVVLDHVGRSLGVHNQLIALGTTVVTHLPWRN